VFDTLLRFGDAREFGVEDRVFEEPLVVAFEEASFSLAKEEAVDSHAAI
jgi:hypothetical protein